MSSKSRHFWIFHHTHSDLTQQKRQLAMNASVQSAALQSNVTLINITAGSRASGMMKIWTTAMQVHQLEHVHIVAHDAWHHVHYCIQQLITLLQLYQITSVITLVTIDGPTMMAWYRKMRWGYSLPCSHNDSHKWVNVPSLSPLDLYSSAVEWQGQGGGCGERARYTLLLIRRSPWAFQLGR